MVALRAQKTTLGYLSSYGKTKNTHCLEMLKLSKNRGFNTQVVVMDAWYSSLKNLKSIKDMGLSFVRRCCIIRQRRQKGTKSNKK